VVRIWGGEAFNRILPQGLKGRYISIEESDLFYQIETFQKIPIKGYLDT